MGAPASVQATPIYSGFQNITVVTTDPSTPAVYELDLNNDATVDMVMLGFLTGNSSPFYSATLAKAKDGLPGAPNQTKFLGGKGYGLKFGRPYGGSFNVGTGGKPGYPKAALQFHIDDSPAPPKNVGAWASAQKKGMQEPGALALSFDISGNTHYGWVRVEPITTTTSAGFTIVDWGYESDPDTPVHIPAIPEPSSLSLFALGAAGLLALRKRRGAKDPEPKA